MPEPTAETEVWRSPFIISFDGSKRYRQERSVTRVDDWRETVIGPVNFGFVLMGPPRFVEVDDA